MLVTEQGSQSVAEVVEVAHELNFVFLVVQVALPEIKLVFHIKHQPLQIDRFHFGVQNATFVASLCLINKVTIEALR